MPENHDCPRLPKIAQRLPNDSGPFWVIWAMCNPLPKLPNSYQLAAHSVGHCPNCPRARNCMLVQYSFTLAVDPATVVLSTVVLSTVVLSTVVLSTGGGRADALVF